MRGLQMTNALLVRAVLALLTCLLLNPASAFAIEPAVPPLSARVGDFVRIPVEHPAEGLCTQANTVALHLDGLDTGLRAVGCDEPAAAPAYLTFRLLRHDAQSPGADTAWARMLGNPWETPKGDFVRSFQVSLYGASVGRIAPLSPQLDLTLIRGALAVFGAAIVVAVWLGLLFAGRCSGMLRDSNSVEGGLRRSYSLARVQMAWWFGLVFGAYVFLWFMTGDWSQLNGSILALIGISGGTTLTAAGIDQSANRAMPSTEGLWRDILTDVNGITLPRFQLLVWNLTLGIFFVIRLATDLRMPEFDATTLGLLGLSAGAYVGFKLPEKHGAETGAAPEAADDPKRGYAPLEPAAPA